ncbi:MAG: adenosylcobinamide amidohydrolase, partial [Deltaproteobacteria bacterium]|nr:adenosylcobinamide amidohydrolase [Deltaproteobacteria bacterium]
STSRANGGYREDLLYVFNHQACEPSGHGGGKAMMGYTDPDRYQADVCARHGIGPPSRCASLSTAANMRLCDVKSESYKDLTVVAVATAGVESNAGRAGDPASGYEGRDGYEAIPRWRKAHAEAHRLPSAEPGPEASGGESAGTAGEGRSGPGDAGDPAAPDDGPSGPPPHGTINTLVFMNLPLTPGCLARVIMTATEAKTAVLQELNINSRYSDGLATGTGTDQIAAAALFVEGFPALSSAGKHSKLGELIGVTVKGAVRGALLRQNSLSPDRQCSVKILTERLFEKEGVFRSTRDEVAELFSASMDPETAELFRCNSKAALCDPATVAACAAMMHLRDQFAWGTLPPLLWPEIMSSQAALLAAAAGGDFSRTGSYRERLGDLSPDRTREGFIRLVGKALAMGYSDKWEKGV